MTNTCSIFEPLGITTLHFGGERPDLGSRFAGLHQRDATGIITLRGDKAFLSKRAQYLVFFLFYPEQLPIVNKTDWHGGGAGLSGEVGDYLKILACLLNEGVGPNGARILQSETVNLVFQNSLSESSTKALENPIVTVMPWLFNTVPNMALK